MPKHLGKVNGVPVFSALHSVVNEYNEVRQMTLTPTKAHNQFIPVLAEIPNSLRMYGHGDVEVIFTDNVRADKHELEHAFPSLRTGVIPVCSSSLPALTLPDIWRNSTQVLRSTFQVNLRLDPLLVEIHDQALGSEFTVALDMEWSVDRSQGIHGKVAVIQIAFDTTIFIIQVCV